MLFSSPPVSVSISLVLRVSLTYIAYVFPRFEGERTHKFVMQPADLCLAVTCGGSWSSLEHRRLFFHKDLTSPGYRLLLYLL